MCHLCKYINIYDVQYMVNYIEKPMRYTILSSFENWRSRTNKSYLSRRNIVRQVFRKFVIQECHHKTGKHIKVIPDSRVLYLNKNRNNKLLPSLSLLRTEDELLKLMRKCRLELHFHSVCAQVLRFPFNKKCNAQEAEEWEAVSWI